jgi:CheY-like chemotaxis protein
VTPRCILIVDDEESIREIAQLSLEMVGGHKVLTATSGLEALAIAAADVPDLVLLDVMMPELDGPGTVSRLQADPRTRDIDIVMLTAKVQQNETARFSQLPGVAGVIGKPFDPMTLPLQIAELLGWDTS